MLFPWYIKYPNQNNEILNLDWILSTIDNLVKEVSDFVTLNTIKYADPIQWNITTQYEKNTVVIDPITGSAYISTKPVPAGVGLNNEDYWNIIFTLDVISANKNITLRDDANNILATFESEVDDWLLWQGTLYIVTKDIEIGQSYVIGYNIERMTVELYLKAYIQNVINLIGDLDDLTTEDKSTLVAALNEVNEKFSSAIGDLDDLTTEDKTSVVAALNEVNQNFSSAIGDLDDLTTEDKSSVVAALNEVNENFSSAIGDLDDLTTEDKSSVVAALNEVNENLSDITLSIPNILDFGVVGNGVTDNTTALNNLSAGVYYIPNGTYLYSGIIELSDVILIGQSKDNVILKNMPTVTYQEIQLTNSGIENATIEDRSTPVANVANVRLLGDRSYIKNCNINLSEDGHIGVAVNTNGIIEKCIFDGSTTAMFGIYGRTTTTSVKVSDCTFTDFWLNAIYTEGLKLEVDNCIMHDNHHQETPNGGGQICVTGEALGNTTYDIRNCYVYNPAGNSTYAIETFNATGVIASNLLIGNSTAPTIRVQQSQNDVIIGNTIINGVQGIQIVGGATQKANTVIEGNTFKTPVQTCIYMANDVKDVVAIGNNVNGNAFYDGTTRKAFLNYQCAGATLFSITTGNSVEIDVPMDITRLSGGVMCDLTLYYGGAFHNVIGRLLENGFASFVNDGTATIVYNNSTKKLTITGTGSYIEGWYRFY